MNIPASTYRVQLHQGFTFKDLSGIIDYLHSLGITTIYSAPILQAAPGSMHGYDVTDPHTINTEIGTLEDLKQITAKLKEKKMTWLQDIVPNHMAFNTGNHRLMDVMERGDQSPYYRYFDIDWDHPSPDLKGKLMVPFVGKEISEAVEANEIKISFSEHGFTVDYFDTRYPLSVSAYQILFEDRNTDICWTTLIKKTAGDLQAWRQVKTDFIDSILKDRGKLETVRTVVARANEDKKMLVDILSQLHYVLCYWKRTEKEINYRRFFTVNELICLRMEDQQVFDEYHTFLHSLYKEKIIQGVRIDHIDGLKDPGEYVQRLRNLFGPDCYIVAEKILEAKEGMPSHWPLEGTSGYEFLSYVSQLITSRKGAKQLLNFYRELVPGLPAYKELVFKNKNLILNNYMAGEWANLVHNFTSLELSGNFPSERIREALGLLMVSLPVYRIYPEQVPLHGEELNVMNEAFQKAIAHGADLKAELEHLQQLFSGSPKDDDQRDRIMLFLKRLMQFTGPLTAKGVEDTTFYVYNALISHDEVGDSPSTLGISISTFHSRMLTRQRSTPLSLNATATHDTKRGEDARLRLNVLTEFPEAWQDCVKKWFEVNKSFHQRVKGRMAPDVNDEYYIYQSITGGFPEDMVVTEEWIKRLETYYVKVLREAKRHSDWGEPDEAYEHACTSFIRSILRAGSAFLDSFLPFAKKVIDRANRYALAQVLVKMTSPGIPDTYQGCELWDLSFVDPDNRRPVDYERRKAALNMLASEKPDSPAFADLMNSFRAEGIEKLFVTWRALQHRRDHNTLFTEGSYIPLQTTGKDVVTHAYARHHGNDWVVIVIPLGAEKIEATTDDEIILPANAPQSWKNVLTGEKFKTDGRMNVFDCVKYFGVAMISGA
jgi:(1->4)-alpha-D-glucan 1-alpha-D-glucosylmutase